jgi:hypothetical protein
MSAVLETEVKKHKMENQSSTRKLTYYNFPKGGLLAYAQPAAVVVDTVDLT